MIFKIAGVATALSFDVLQDVILRALKSEGKEFTIEVFDEGDNHIASALIDVSGSSVALDELPLTEHFKNTHIDNPKAIVAQKNTILAALTNSLIQLNDEIKRQSGRVAEQLVKYRELFMYYPFEASALHQFIRNNKEYESVFEAFLPGFSQLSTKEFQTALGGLYGEFVSREKDLASTLIDEEQRKDIVRKSEASVARKQGEMATFLAAPQNVPMLVFLAGELPKFAVAAAAWDSYSTSAQEKHAQKQKELEEQFNHVRQKEILATDTRLQTYARSVLGLYIKQFPEQYKEATRTDIPEQFLKHAGMRQKIIKLLFPAEPRMDLTKPLKQPGFEHVLALINNDSLINNPKLMDLYAHEYIDNYSHIQPKQNFKEYNLSYLFLDKFHMSESTFEKTNLANSTLSNGRFFNANFEKAILTNADLHGSDFSFASFSGADLRGVNLKGAILDYVDWGRAALSEDTLIDWDKYGADIILSQLKAIGQATDLNRAQQKAEAKQCINLILPKISSNKSLLKLVALIEGKHKDYAYLREEQAQWRFNQYGNTRTWSTIIGQIKEQLDCNVALEGKKQEEEKECYTGEEYKTFLKIMDEHRGRGFGSVSHSKLYEHFSEDELNSIQSMKISKK